MPIFQDRVGHSGSGFPGGPRTPVSDFQPPYFPPPFGGQQPTAQEVFAAAQAPHLAAAAAATADPYTNSALHNFQTSQVKSDLVFSFKTRNVKNFPRSSINVITPFSRDNSFFFQVLLFLNNETRRSH